MHIMRLARFSGDHCLHTLHSHQPAGHPWPQVKTDSSYSYYRLVVDLVIRQQDTWSPDLTKPSLFQGVVRARRVAHRSLRA